MNRLLDKKNNMIRITTMGNRLLSIQSGAQVRAGANTRAKAMRADSVERKRQLAAQTIQTQVREFLSWPKCPLTLEYLRPDNWVVVCVQKSQEVTEYTK